MMIKENIFKCPRCGNPKIVEYEKTFDCTICKDKDGMPLEFSKEDFMQIEEKSNILSIQEKLAIYKTLENKPRNSESFPL